MLRKIRAVLEESSESELALHLPNSAEIFNRVAIRANAKSRWEAD